MVALVLLAVAAGLVIATLPIYRRERRGLPSLDGAPNWLLQTSHGIFATHYQEVGAALESFLLSLKS